MYRESSLILELFSRDFGRVGVIAKGVRGQKSRHKNLLQAFQLLQISWVGKGDLYTLTDVDTESSEAMLSGCCVAGGFYINELLMHFLVRHDPHEYLFDAYRQCLLQLKHKKQIEEPLRLFEKKFLEELGYGLQLDAEVTTGDPIDAQQLYDFRLEQGPTLVSSQVEVQGIPIHGVSLMALANNDISDTNVRHEVKRLMRYVIGHLLGGKKINSRSMFANVF